MFFCSWPRSNILPRANRFLMFLPMIILLEFDNGSSVFMQLVLESLFWVLIYCDCKYNPKHSNLTILLISEQYIKAHGYCGRCFKIRLMKIYKYNKFNECQCALFLANLLNSQCTQNIIREKSFYSHQKISFFFFDVNT